ncbi:MAG TPA: glycoside hydrolase family 2 protein, partial [Polyangia bacterium]|nr:glycoside hydrolase family 2 protein [Polyangia bacterium]
MPLRIQLGDWQIRATPPGAVADARDLPADGWTPARAPGTAAAALRAAQAWSLESPPRRFDAEDWWWRTRFPDPATPEGAPADEIVLGFDGLATLADVWLNGAPLFSSENMFVAHQHAVKLAGDNELVIRFRSLDAALGARRPRPRWRAPMIENQQLRWFRTTLLGRTPGWSPPAAAVGPWRAVYLEQRRGLAVEDARVVARLEGPDGPGVVEVSCDARVLDGGDRGQIDLVVERGGKEHRGRLASDGRATVTVEKPALWWPHTHGEPACYRTWLEVHRGATVERIDTGPVGFRDLAVRTDGDGFEIHVGGRRIFCRGACWTPLDPVTLAADRTALAAAIDQVVAAGMNMLRVGGTMVYESDDFYDLCDERGVLVWQDLMFANMDYPDDAAFQASVALEVRQNLGRIGGRPSLALVCGGSEVEQQAAMWGAPREAWSARLSHEALPALVREACPGVFYWPSSAHGGTFPHQPSVGTTSYYGVGAYLRPLEDARRSEVRFASE